VLGKVRHPLNPQDFSSFLLQAQASKAKIIGLANAGGDTTNAIKQAAEFGITKGGQNLAGLLVFIPTCTPGPARGAGPDLHRDLLLGPERPDPRLVQALRGA
jgi:ABC-type branched-subunit amino acid transport system substrate-binding protein